MKNFTIFALSATAAFAQVPTHVVAAPAPVAATAPVATATYTAPTTDEAPLAPINMQLLQNHPGAPTGIEDVLLVPSANAGQQAVGFQWVDGANSDAYVLWKNYFAAAQYTGATAANDAQTIASFGLMNPVWGAGLSLAYAQTYTEPVATKPNVTTYEALSQAKLFGSTGWEGKDVYASLLWKKPTTNVETEPLVGSTVTTPRTDSVILSAGIRKYPPVGVEGLAWSGNAALGYYYDRTPAVAPAVGSNQTIWEASLYGQLGYVFVTDGIEFLPGIDALLNYANGVNAPDYGYQYGVSPYVAIILPIFEHWTLDGGARYYVQQTVMDVYPGKPSVFEDNASISTTQGSVGLRYTHNRWALEGSVANGFLVNGPYLLSGTATGGLIGSLALTVNLK
ncbi:MAG TPA: hypothetical protein VN931_10960 [Fibrobacteria bacterium]|nr:hypothetical protein [Fibrobacteria bacterium]